MGQLITNTGERYSVKWCAVSTIDGFLRFLLNSTTLTDAVATFSNSQNTKKIVYEIDEDNRKTFEGYTTLQGVSLQGDDTVVTLKKGD